MVTKNEIFDYVKNKYNIIPKYLWFKNPSYAVLKHEDNNKWFAIIMNISPEKLGLEGTEEIEIINIKSYPEIVGSLRKEKGVFPAYHMNKEYWVSIILESNFSKEKLFDLIDLSYELTE